jgi:hypothetical protein
MKDRMGCELIFIQNGWQLVTQGSSSYRQFDWWHMIFHPLPRQKTGSFRWARCQFNAAIASEGNRDFSLWVEPRCLTKKKVEKKFTFCTPIFSGSTFLMV